MALVCLYDHSDASLAPLTDLRPSFDIRTGALTTRQRLERTIDGEIVIWVAEALRPLYPRCDSAARIADESGAVLCLSGAWLDPTEAMLPALGEALVCGETVLAARLPAEQAREFLESRELPSEVHMRQVTDAKVLRRPWDVVRYAKELLSADLELLLKDARQREIKATVVGDSGALVHESARLYPGVVLDVESGPVVIDANAIIRPNAVITGPAYIGPETQINDTAVIRAGTSVGPACKVGGEVGATIFQGYSNKGHDGYIGDSFIGEWVNLGAGTITSNLKNTYGSVRARQHTDAREEDSGLTFLGSILGDHVKTAIGTRLLTGTIVHTAAMLAISVFPPKCIERFAFLTDADEERYDIDRFLEVAQRVMARRDVRIAEAYADRLRAMHEAV